MAEPTGAPVVRLHPGEFVHLDVEFCDVVPPIDGETTPGLRFKGRQVGADGRVLKPLCRVFLDNAEAVAVTMRKTGVLRADAVLPELPIGEQAAPVTLAHRRLTMRRVQGPRQIIYLDIAPRAGAVAAQDEEILADYHWAYGHARNTVAPLLDAERYPLGAAELLTITTTLFHERRRGRLNRG